MEMAKFRNDYSQKWMAPTSHHTGNHGTYHYGFGNTLLKKIGMIEMKKPDEDAKY